MSDKVDAVRLHALQQARIAVKTAKINVVLAFSDTDVGGMYAVQFDELLHELDVDIAELTPPASKWYVFDEADCFDSFKSVAEAGARAEKMIVDGFKGVKIEYLSTEEFDNLTQGKH